jgi:hypothetical protein
VTTVISDVLGVKDAGEKVCSWKGDICGARLDGDIEGVFTNLDLGCSVGWHKGCMLGCLLG